MASGPQEITNISEVLPAPTSNGTATANGSSSGGSGSGNGEKALAPRKERSKSRDLGKRMGGGQKGVWSKPGEVISPVAAVDDNDPNYDSEGEENVILVSTSQSPVKKASPVNLAPDALAAKELAVNPPPAIKKRIIEIIDEYLISADAEEVKSSLKEMNEDEFQYEVVKRAITIAMDKHDKERELVSRLFSHLYLNGLTPSQIAMGFRRVLLLADDLQIDIPTARSMLAIFIARGVVDEIVPPSFLEDPFIHRYTPDIAADAIKKLSINHGTARLEKAWGPGDGRPVGELKVAIDQLTKEYLLSSDLEEAARCVRELNVPHFHHEVVKRGLLNALEEEDGDSGDARSTAMSSLLAYLVAQEIVSSDQLRKGFERMKIGIPDVALDIPNASTLFNALVDRAKRDGILPTSFDATAPSSQ